MTHTTDNTDSALAPIALDQRQHWLIPATIFGGLQFAVPVMMLGAALISHMSLIALFQLLCIAMSIQWLGNALQGYMGAKTGLSCTVMARYSFGVIQSRIIFAIVVGFLTIGWGAIQNEVAGNALCALLGIDYEQQRVMWAILTSLLALGFALPSIIGYNSMKWVDIIAVPAGIALIGTGLYLAFQKIGLSNILAWQPDSGISLFKGISMVLGLSVGQWLIASDYTRYSKPLIKDQILIPLGTLSVGLPLLMIGAVMSIGMGEADFVKVMIKLNFPTWGYLTLILAVWTSLLVNNYTMGLAFSNTLNIHSAKGRRYVTLLCIFIVIGVTLSGIVDNFQDYLYLSSVAFPPIVGVMFSSFYLLSVRPEVSKIPENWNIQATLAIASGFIIGYYTQYHHEIGIAPLQSLIGSAVIYYLLMKVKTPTQRTD